MAEISSLLTLQGQLALLTLIGFFLARKGIINAQGRKCLTDLLINVILPANIIQSFLVEFSWDVLKSSASILVISLALQIGCVVLCALGYNWLPFARRSVYQYGTVCSNGAFLGSALVDGIWGSSGLVRFDCVAAIFGGQLSVWSRIIYTLVGIAGLWCITLLFREDDVE